jgi:hypothetical protein
VEVWLKGEEVVGGRLQDTELQVMMLLRWGWSWQKTRQQGVIPSPRHITCEAVLKADRIQRNCDVFQFQIFYFRRFKATMGSRKTTQSFV